MEVRKPGRPLESCGHEFATCTCGKLAELMAVGQSKFTERPCEVYFSNTNPCKVISDTTSQNNQQDQPNLVLVCPPSRTVKTRTPRVRAQRRASKTQRRKPRSPSTASRLTPSTQTSLDSREASIDREMGSVSDTAQPSSFGHLSQEHPLPYQNSSTQVHPPTAFLPSNEHSPQASFMPQPSQIPRNPPSYTYPQMQPQPIYPTQINGQFAPQTYPNRVSAYSTYSSRVEDVRMTPDGQPAPNRSEYASPQIQSQYIVALPENTWRDIR